MEEMDSTSNMRNIVLMLPHTLRERWHNNAYELLKGHNHRIIMNVLLINKLADPKGELKSGAKPRFKSQVSKLRGNSFTTSVAGDK